MTSSRDADPFKVSIEIPVARNPGVFDMIAPYNPSAPVVNPIARWEDDGGPAPATSSTSHCPPVNVGNSERVLSALAGGSLLIYGLSRRSPLGLMTAIIGGGLLYRGLTGHCQLYALLGVSAGGDGCGLEARGADLSPAELTPSTLASGPVEFRSSATPPLHVAAEDSSPEAKSLSAVTDAHPATSLDEETSREEALPPRAITDPGSHSSDRHSEGSSPAEPQGRT